MKEQLDIYASQFNPLSLAEQNELLDLPRDDLLTKLIQHNARIIIKEVNKWYNTFEDIDDVAILAMQGVIRAYDKWDKQVLFGPFCRMYISAFIHRQWKKYIQLAGSTDISEFDSIASEEDHWSDLDDIVENAMTMVLNDKEYQFIKDIYWNNMTIKEAGSTYGYKTSPSTSRKKGEILNKLAEYIGIDDIMLYLGDK